MSNIVIQDHKAFDEIDSFLSNPSNSIKIIDEDTGETINYLKDNKTFSLWDKETINSKYNSTFELFNYLYKKNYQSFTVNFRKANGYNATKSGGEIKLRLVGNTMLRKSGDDNDASNSHNDASYHSFNNQNSMNNNQHPLGALGYASQQAGLGFNELVDLKAKAKAYDELETAHKDLKKRYDTLEIDNKALSSKVETAKKELELAVKEAQLEQKSFTDSEGFAKIMDAVPSLAGILMEAKKGGAPAPTGLGAPETNVSEAKKQVIEFIKSDQVSDEQAERFFSTVLYHMSQTQGFSDDLTELVRKYTAE